MTTQFRVLFSPLKIGTVTVTGDGSKWTNSGFVAIGDSGKGTLTVEDGGSVSNTDGYLGYSAGSNGNWPAVSVRLAASSSSAITDRP
jgi:T5SS/PEP-CTERM-associated repeat protein